MQGMSEYKTYYLSNKKELNMVSPALEKKGFIVGSPLRVTSYSFSSDVHTSISHAI